MPILSRNVNELWANILTETLKRLGLTTVVICPGSRSTPLAVSFANASPDIEAISILDERSAAFFALGRAKATGLPTAVISTSGTAGANFYSSVIEAKESRVPLLLLTADRPPELRECHSGQTIDQVKLYGNYPNWQAELALPSSDVNILTYLRQTLIHAWERCLYPVPGVVHLNIPFRDPLSPVPDGVDFSYLQSYFDSEDFFSSLINRYSNSTSTSTPIYPEWLKCSRGIIIAGVAQPQNPKEYCRAIAKLSQILQWPVLGEGLSPVRNYQEYNPHLISTYDIILRNTELAQQLIPEIVIQIGDMPTSKELRSWLSKTQARCWVIDKSGENLDPLHGRTTHLRLSIEELVRGMESEELGVGNWEWAVGEEEIEESEEQQIGENKEEEIRVEQVTISHEKLAFFNSPLPYLQKWCTTEARIRTAVDEKMAKIEEFVESKVAWLLSVTLPKSTPLFISNSMPVRDVEFFWKPGNSEVRPFVNRGANGIDGTLSTALGVAHHNQSSVMLTGDLALLHDTNGFLVRNKFAGHLSIVLINNNGGGIFEMLPIAKFDPPFEEFFATPQDIDFAQLCATYSLEHELITSWEHLQQKLTQLPNKGIRVLELRTNRKVDAQWRRENLSKFASELR